MQILMQLHQRDAAAHVYVPPGEKKHHTVSRLEGKNLQADRTVWSTIVQKLRKYGSYLGLS